MKKMDKIKKVTTSLLTVLPIMSMLSYVLAENGTDIQGSISIDPTGITGTEAGNMAGMVLGVVQFFGYAIAIGMIIYIGIKYMMSSANEKADLKKGAINYVIGAILVAAATAVVGVFWQFGGKMGGTTTE